MGAILALALVVLPQSGAGPLEARLAAWPDWNLPAPLERPGRRDLVYPEWFAGSWRAHGDDGSTYPVRFLTDPSGAITGDRAFNARALAAAVVGDLLLGVDNDPANPNRQIARLRSPGGTCFELESSVIGRRSARPSENVFLADELSLQVLHGPGAPRLSQVETLSRFERRADGGIDARQWQATYPSPSEGLRSRAGSTHQSGLRLERSPRAGSETAQPGQDPVPPLEQRQEQGMVGDAAHAMAGQRGTGTGRELQEG